MAYDIRKKFGERVQVLRKEKKISQEELAERVGVHRTYMGFIERGQRNPTLTRVYKIAQELKIPLSDLFNF